MTHSDRKVLWFAGAIGAVLVLAAEWFFVPSGTTKVVILVCALIFLGYALFKLSHHRRRRR